MGRRKGEGGDAECPLLCPHTGAEPQGLSRPSVSIYSKVAFFPDFGSPEDTALSAPGS